MNNFQPINNGDSGLDARIKINNLGTKALGAEHETDKEAHPGYVSRYRGGAKGSENPYPADQTENIASNLAMNIYGNNGSFFGLEKYIGAYSLNASTIKRIIANYNGSETSMPSYWGINCEHIGDANNPNSYFFAGLFILSRNEEDNNVAYPYKVILFSGKDGSKKAYFKNGSTPELTAWQLIGSSSDGASVDPATTTTYGTVKLGASTGDSTDMGKVAVLGAAGLNSKIIPSMPGWMERKTTLSITNAGTINILAADTFEMYEVQVTASGFGGHLYLPVVATNRGRIKILLRIKNTGSSAVTFNVWPFDSWRGAPTSITTGAAAGTYNYMLIAEQLGDGFWGITQQTTNTPIDYPSF